MRRSLVILLTAALLTALVGCSFSNIKAKKAVTTNLDHIPGSALMVDTRNGSIRIEADASNDDVSIESTITCAGATQTEADERVAQARLSVERDVSRKLTIKPIFPGGHRDGDGASVVIRLPGADGVTAETSNGHVYVRGVSGRLFIDTSNGPVDVHNATGELIIDTSNGPITIIDHSGDAVIETSNGPARIERQVGSLKLDTSNGSVTVVDLDGPAVIDTSNGPIRISLAPDQPGPVWLDTSNGSISLTVGPAFRGQMTLDTSNGSIRLDDKSGIITSTHYSKSHSTIMIGPDSAGAKSSRIDTSNGRIELRIEG